MKGGELDQIGRDRPGHGLLLPAGRAAPPQGPPWRVDAATAGAGHFLDVGSHALDLLDFLIGPLADVSGGGESGVGLRRRGHRGAHRARARGRLAP
jgi:predicted dehydrogenase